MESHKTVLLAAIDTEISLLGDKADVILPNQFISARQGMECAKEHLSMRRPWIRDVCHYIQRVSEGLAPNGKPSISWEGCLRTIELIWRIEREWKLI